MAPSTLASPASTSSPRPPRPWPHPHHYLALTPPVPPSLAPIPSPPALPSPRRCPPSPHRSRSTFTSPLPAFTSPLPAPRSTFTSPLPAFTFPRRSPLHHPLTAPRLHLAAFHHLLALPPSPHHFLASITASRPRSLPFLFALPLPTASSHVLVPRLAHCAGSPGHLAQPSTLTFPRLIPIAARIAG